MNQEIIKLALSRGFKLDNIITPIKKCEQDPVFPERFNIEGADGYFDWFVYNDILLDKEFWIALGKSLGLERYDKGLCSVTGEWEDLNPAFFADCLPHREATLTPDSLAHQFLDARFEGREQEFFKELIEKR